MRARRLLSKVRDLARMKERVSRSWRIMGLVHLARAHLAASRAARKARRSKGAGAADAQQEAKSDAEGDSSGSGSTDGDDEEDEEGEEDEELPATGPTRGQPVPEANPATGPAAKPVDEPDAKPAVMQPGGPQDSPLAVIVIHSDSDAEPELQIVHVKNAAGGQSSQMQHVARLRRLWKGISASLHPSGTATLELRSLGQEPSAQDNGSDDAQMPSATSTSSLAHEPTQRASSVGLEPLRDEDSVKLGLAEEPLMPEEADRLQPVVLHLERSAKPAAELELAGEPPARLTVEEEAEKMQALQRSAKPAGEPPRRIAEEEAEKLQALEQPAAELGLAGEPPAPVAVEPPPQLMSNAKSRRAYTAARQNFVGTNKEWLASDARLEQLHFMPESEKKRRKFL